MSTDEGNIRGRSRAVGGKSGWTILVEGGTRGDLNGRVQPFPSSRGSVIFCPRKPGGVMSVKVTHHQLISTVFQEQVKIGSVALWTGG